MPELYLSADTDAFDDFLYELKRITSDTLTIRAEVPDARPNARMRVSYRSAHVEVQNTAAADALAVAISQAVARAPLDRLVVRGPAGELTLERNDRAELPLQDLLKDTD